MPAIALLQTVAMRLRGDRRIGRLKQGPERDLAERYRERFDDIGRKLGFRGLEIHEIPESRARDAATRMAEEAAAIAALIPEKAVLVALDERGKSIDSVGFAQQLGRWRDEGIAQRNFRNRRRGRTFARIAAQGKAAHCVRRGDLAASDGSRHASGTDLPGRDDFGRPSLSPRLGTVTWTTENAESDRMQSTQNIHAHPDTAGRGARRRLPSRFHALLLAMLLSAGFVALPLAPAAAQQAAPTQQATAASPDIIKQREQELEAARAAAAQRHRSRSRS